MLEARRAGTWVSLMWTCWKCSEAGVGTVAMIKDKRKVHVSSMCERRLLWGNVAVDVPCKCMVCFEVIFLLQLSSSTVMVHAKGHSFVQHQTR